MRVEFSYYIVQNIFTFPLFPHHSLYILNNLIPVTTDSTVVKFGAEAFTDPYEYLGLDETVSRVNGYKRFITSTNAPNAGFKPGIRDTVIATRKVEDIWFREKTEYTKYLVWRYVGTANGVFRMTPGTLLAKSYDPRKRPWLVMYL